MWSMSEGFGWIKGRGLYSYMDCSFEFSFIEYILPSSSQRQAIELHR